MKPLKLPKVFLKCFWIKDFELIVQGEIVFLRGLFFQQHLIRQVILDAKLTLSHRNINMFLPWQQKIGQQR